MKDEVLYKYLKDEVSEEEKRAVEKWLEDEKNFYYFLDLKAIWQAKMILHPENDLVEDSLIQLNERIDAFSSSKRSVRLIPQWYTYAAAIFLLLIIGSAVFYWIEKPLESHTPSFIVVSNHQPDSVMTIFLPDDSEVWLTYNTTIKYPEHFNGEKRKVELSGQAFFQVKRDTGKPFVVQTETTSVEVLGTSFSINTRYADFITETILVNGSVKVHAKEEGTGILLHPGQQALYFADTQTLEINEVDAKELTSWRLGIISLQAISIQTILKTLEEIYSVHLQIDHSSLENKLYNFSFKRSKGIEDAIEQLHLMTGEKIEFIQE